MRTGAVKTGNKLYKDFDLKVSTSYDAFYRPYTKWTLGKDSVEVMEAPKATFTTRFSACDLLAELGVARLITRGPKAGKIFHGVHAIYSGCSACVSQAIRGEKRRVDKTFSVDHVSQGNDTTAPEKYDIPDFRSISKQQAKELGHSITIAIRKNAKNNDDAQQSIFICNALIKGYTQAQIAKALGRSQSYVAKRLNKIRTLLLPFVK